MIANEFNELFGSRYINLPFVFLVYGIIMAGYKYENWASFSTYLVREPKFEPELNYVLKFFLSSILMILIGGLYYGRPSVIQ